MVYSIIVIYFSNTNSTSASLDSAFCVRAGENAHASARPCIGGRRIRERWLLSGIVPVSHLGHLVLARDETNERPMNSPRLTPPEAKAK